MDARSHCSLWICLATAGTLACVRPEAHNWKDRRDHARPLPNVKLLQLWDHPATLCPETSPTQATTACSCTVPMGPRGWTPPA